MSEQQILEAELEARQQEVAELEITLANLEKELETLQQFLIQRQEAAPSQEILPETIVDTPIIRTPSVADSILSMTYREWIPTFTIEAPKVVVEEPSRVPIPIAPPIEAPKVAVEEPLILAEPEPLKEKILFLDWLKNNWPWIGIGLVSLSLIITIAKD